MDKTILLFSFVLSFLITIPSYAQQEHVIKGYVLDQQTRQPLIGANITIPSTSKGTVTDRQGYFQLTVDGDAQQIQVSYIGYVNQNVMLRGEGKSLNILLEPDNVALNEVQVIGFDTNKKLQATAASVALLTGKDFERTSEVSLQPVLNTVPGVQMDQSGLNDARLSIRGAGIRSGFGTRNIKIYINNIPLTEADGFTRIEGLDVSAVGRAEIIKGPASSIYGAGTGGVINFQLEKAPYGTNSGLYTSFYDLDHPLSFAYIRHPYQSYGGRTRFVFDPGINVLPTTFTIGGEYLNGRMDAKRFVNNEGEEGALMLNQEQDNTQYSLFYQSETSLSSRTTLTLGVSVNKVRYEVTNFMNDSLSGIKDFDAELAPRVALAHVFSDRIALRAGISSGFSPPTTSEITDAGGRINDRIQAERGINYEIGARGNLLENNFNYDLALFSFQMEDQLVPQAVSQGNTIYLNAGETSRRGLEAALSYFWSNESSEFINSVHPFISYSYSDFTFEVFRILDAEGQVQSDYSGNDVTGIAPHILSAGIDVDTDPGFYLNATYFFKDKTPVTDENDVYNKAYSLVNTKAGFRRKIKNVLKIDVSAGVKNLLDESYSSLVSLNAGSYGDVPPAFFNPAPERNFYSSISVSYFF